MEPVKPIVPVTPPVNPVTPPIVPVQRQTHFPETVVPVMASAVDNGTLSAMIENTDTNTEPTTGPETLARPPLTGMQLQYITAPAPIYPREALRAGLEGTVLLRVLVGPDGMPLEVSIEKSSGHRVLDATARQQMLKRGKFRPAMHQGQVVQAYGLAPIDFSVQCQDAAWTGGMSAVRTPASPFFWRCPRCNHSTETQIALGEAQARW